MCAPATVAGGRFSTSPARLSELVNCRPIVSSPKQDVRKQPLSISRSIQALSSDSRGGTEASILCFWRTLPSVHMPACARGSQQGVKLLLSEFKV